MNLCNLPMITSTTYTKIQTMQKSLAKPKDSPGELEKIMQQSEPEQPSEKKKSTKWTAVMKEFFEDEAKHFALNVENPETGVTRPKTTIDEFFASMRFAENWLEEKNAAHGIVNEYDEDSDYGKVSWLLCFSSVCRFYEGLV